MRSRLIDWLTDGRPHPCDKIDEISISWEREYSNEAQLWNEEPDLDRLKAAGVIEADDPKAAFQIYLELAQTGSVWSMNRVAWEYSYGQDKIVKADDALAYDWYQRAAEGGSWMAWLYSARFYEKRGHVAYAKQALEMGVELDWVPAFYWLAYFRQKHSKSRETYREIRPLLEYAADQGHPRAQHLYSGLMSRGKFGFREILRGFKMKMALCAALAEELDKVHEVVVGDLAEVAVKPA